MVSGPRREYATPNDVPVKVPRLVAAFPLVSCPKLCQALLWVHAYQPVVRHLGRQQPGLSSKDSGSLVCSRSLLRDSQDYMDLVSMIAKTLTCIPIPAVVPVRLSTHL